VRPRATLVVVVVLMAGATALLAQTIGYHSPKETLPAAVAPQPVAFSHRLHAGEAGIDCLTCHTGADQGDYAELPTPSDCMVCHEQIAAESPEVQKIAAAAESGEELPWVPVYRVPDFVFFSHKEHLEAGETCAICHGPVETRDVLEKEVSTSMTACFDCHRERGAPVHCALCHILGH
jgi:hypothetical protein